MGVARERGLGILFWSLRPFSEAPGPQANMALALLGIQQMPVEVKRKYIHLGDVSQFLKRHPHVQWLLPLVINQ